MSLGSSLSLISHLSQTFATPIFCPMQIVTLSSGLSTASGEQRNLWITQFSCDHFGLLLQCLQLCLLIPSELTDSYFPQHIILIPLIISFFLIAQITWTSFCEIHSMCPASFLTFAHAKAELLMMTCL